MDLLSAKVPMEQAFQQAFETPFEVMEKDLRDYVKKDRYNVIQRSLRKETGARHHHRSDAVNRSRSASISRRSVAPQPSQGRLHVSAKRR